MGIRDSDELKLIWWLVFKLELAPGPNLIKLLGAYLGT